MSKSNDVDFINEFTGYINAFDLPALNEATAQRCLNEGIKKRISGGNYNNLHKLIPYLLEHDQAINPFISEGCLMKTQEEYPSTIKFEMFDSVEECKIGYSIIDTQHDIHFNKGSDNHCSCVIYRENGEQVLEFTSSLFPYPDTYQEIIHRLSFNQDGLVLNHLVITGGTTWQLDLLTGILSVREGYGSLPEVGVPVQGQVNGIIECLKANAAAAAKIVGNVCIPQVTNADTHQFK